jgi:hypothetical protein
MRRSFWYLQRNGVPFSSLALKFGNYPAALTDDLLYEAQSVYFFTLVVMQWGCVHLLSFFSWCDYMEGTEFDTQKPALYTHTPIEHLATTADVGREPGYDTCRDLRAGHRHLFQLRSRLVRCFLCILSSPEFWKLIVFSPRSHKVFQTSKIPARHFFIPLTFALGLIA